MHPKSASLVRILLNRFPTAASSAILDKLPEGEAKEIAEQVTQVNDPYLVIRSPEENFADIHYSWLPPALQQIPSLLRSYVIAALPAPKRGKLSQLLKEPVVQHEFSDGVKALLLRQLADHFWQVEILPKTFLPSSPLSFLLTKNKEELVEIIDFLGLYDLAEEVRHIVDKNLLRKIYSHLTPKKIQFLRRLLYQKERLMTPKLELDKWDGSRKAFDQLLHKRGISRLGVALSGQHLDMIWYLVHALDTGRGAILEKQIVREEIPKVSSGLIQQVIYTHQFLKSGDGT